MRVSPVRLGHWVAPLLLSLWGVFICLVYGRVGFQPLDQSIVYDGGYRVATGQVPFRHFDLPAGLVPVLLQAGVYLAFGPGWFVYCLHAAVFNGLFALLAFALLRRFGAGTGIALFYAALSALFFYVPLGVPYPDHHSFFFSLLGLFAVIRALDGRSPREAGWLGAGAALAFAAALLSKQIPFGFVAPLAALPFAWGGGERRRQVVVGLALGSLAVAAILGLAAHCWGISPARVHRDLFELPAGTGELRLRVLATSGEAARRLGWVLDRWRLPSVFVAAGLGLFLAAAALRRRSRARTEPARQESRRETLGVLLALGLLFASLAYALLTNRSPTSALPYLFVSVGLLHVAGAGLAGSWRGTLPATGTWRRALGRALAPGLVALSLADAWSFHDRVNRRRESVLLAPLPRGARAEAVASPPALSFLRWAAPGWYRYGWRDLAAVVDFLDRHPGNFLLLGDSSILYALTGRPSVSPSLWFHSGLTYPGHRDPTGFREYQKRLVRRMEVFEVRYVVEEQMRGKLGRRRTAGFHLLQRYVQKRECDRQRFRGFVVVTLCAPAGGQH